MAINYIEKIFKSRYLCIAVFFGENKKKKETLTDL